jgi:hypothetical protein
MNILLFLSPALTIELLYNHSWQTTSFSLVLWDLLRQIQVQVTKYPRRNRVLRRRKKLVSKPGKTKEGEAGGKGVSCGKLG